MIGVISAVTNVSFPRPMKNGLDKKARAIGKPPQKIKKIAKMLHRA
jgi:hypothetical protein